jgi:hypothetical protein
MFFKDFTIKPHLRKWKVLAARRRRIPRAPDPLSDQGANYGRNGSTNCRNGRSFPQEAGKRMNVARPLYSMKVSDAG